MIEAPEAVVEPSEPAFILPLLDASDALVRDALVSLSRHEGLHRWLAVDDLVRKFVGFTQGVSERGALYVLLSKCWHHEPAFLQSESVMTPSF